MNAEAVIHIWFNGYVNDANLQYLKTNFLMAFPILLQQISMQMLLGHKTVFIPKPQSRSNLFLFPSRFKCFKRKFKHSTEVHGRTLTVESYYDEWPAMCDHVKCFTLQPHAVGVLIYEYL